MRRAMSWIEANSNNKPMSKESFEVWLNSQKGKSATKITSQEQFSSMIGSLITTGNIEYCGILKRSEHLSS
jgi:hypothetical protein